MATTKVDVRLGLRAESDAFDAQELEELWVAFSSSSDDSEEFRAPQSVTTHAPEASMMALLLAPLGTPTVAQGQSVRSKKTPQAEAKRNPRTFTPAQVDMRRKRNRDSMRRVRQRKQVEVDLLRKKMELLQDKLHELHSVRDAQATSKRTTNLAVWERTESVRTTIFPAKARSGQEVQELLEEIRALLCEQVRLHNAVLGHEQVSATLAQIMEESKTLYLTSAEASVCESLLHQDEDKFQWVNDVLPLLPPLSRTNVYKLVRQSCLDIVDRITAAAALSHANANKVLGWSDKRQVSGQWADFVFAKEFMNEDVDALVDRTWKALTSSNQSDGFQSRALHLKILEKLNDDALLLARTAHFPVDGRNYSSIYVLLRVKTDDGYVIGGRTICPAPGNEERMAAALGPDRSYAHMFYGLMLSRLSAEMTDASPQQPQSQQRGCQIKYGGRVGNGSVQYAQSWAMDVLLAALRWETACVAPLCRLTPQ